MILYSFKRCPFAIRARMTLIACGLDYEHREVDLKQKPKSLLQYSPKGTVPVLVLKDKTVIDESIDIMRWAIKQKDPMSLARANASQAIINSTMSEFLPRIYHCKYPERYDVDHQEAKTKNQNWLIEFNSVLASNNYVLDDRLSLHDLAIFPFIRQWHNIDQEFTENQANIMRWLNAISCTEFFDQAMTKYPIWSE